MKVCLRKWLGSLLCIGVFLFSGSAFAQAQQSPQTPQPNAAPASTRAQAAAPSPDLAAQEDELIKLCNDQLNVKGQFKDAEDTAKQALDLSQKMGDKKRIMVALIYLASAYTYQGRFSEALKVHQQSADVAREIGNRKGLSRALNNIAGVLGDMGRFEESLNYLYQSMQVARELDDQPMQYTVFRNIGALYLASGDPDKAEAPLQESLRIGRELKHSDLVANPAKVSTEASLLLLGDLEAAREHYQRALNYYQQVVESHPDNPQGMIEALQDMAFAHFKLGSAQKSVELLQQAIPMAEKQHSASCPQLFGGLGESQESLGQLDEALTSESHALALVRQSGGNPDYEWQVEKELGHIHRSMGHNDEALVHYQNSIRGIEQLRAGALNTELGRSGLGGRGRNVYAEAADLLYDMHRESDALQISEQGRARAFLDLLAQARAGLADELTPDHHDRENAILARISSAQKTLWTENLPPDQEKKGKADLAAAEDELEAFHLEVRRSNPRYASIQYPEPVNVAQIQGGLLNEHTALVEFLLGEKRSLAWVISKTGLSTFVLPPRSEIEDQVESYRKLLAQHASALTLSQSLEDIHRLGTRLYISLIRPIEAAITSQRALIVVPDGALNYLPFEALVVPARHSSSPQSSPPFLVEKFVVLYGPSASALVTVQSLNRKSSNPQKTLLAFGDPATHFTASASPTTPSADSTRSTPDAEKPPAPSVADDYTERGFSFTPLPYARDEVLAISKLFPPSQSQVYLGPDAREETVKSTNLEAFRFIHFASHGFIDEVKPGRSGIVLSRDPKSQEDGVLQVGEIMGLKLNADLVTLSACSTGLGKLVSGEGMLGLTRAFFYSGARNLTVSLWNVNDSATGLLMKVYYENLKRGQPISVALQQAKLSLLRGSNLTWRQPYFWASFVLVGNDRF